MKLSGVVVRWMVMVMMVDGEKGDSERSEGKARDGDDGSGG